MLKVVQSLHKHACFYGKGNCQAAAVFSLANGVAKDMRIKPFEISNFVTARRLDHLASFILALRGFLTNLWSIQDSKDT